MMINLLRQSWVALCVLLLALIAQIPHAAFVFDAAPHIGSQRWESAWYAMLLAYAYAIALESATLMFVLHGHRIASNGFAGASFLVNLAYYAMHGVPLFSVAALPVWLLSALLPIAIASYSHIFAGAHGDASFDWRQWLPSMLRDDETKEIEPMPEPVHTNGHVAGDLVDDGAVDNQREIAIAMRGEGLSYAKIAERFNVHPSTVARWTKS